MKLRAAMLGRRDVAGPAQALEPPARRDAKAVHVARRNPGRAGQSHEQRVEIGALAAKVSGLEHAAYVAETAAAHCRVTDRVLHDPVVDGARLRFVVRGMSGDSLRYFANHAVEREQTGWLEIAPQRRRRGRSDRSSPVDGAV